MSRLRRAKPWADVTLIRPFQRVTLALLRVGDRSSHDRPRVSSSSTTGSHDSARPQASRSRPDNLRGSHARTHDDGADRPHGCQSGRCFGTRRPVDSVSGEVDGAASDHQFGIYVRLRLSAVDVLEDSQQFKRDLDNSMNHSGDPINYRAQAVSPPFRSPSRSIGGTATSTSTIDRQCSRRVWDSRHESLVLTRVELTSTPNALADASECAARAAPLCRPLPLEYGEGFGINVRFNTRSGEAGVLRGLWRKENTNWRITSCDIEQSEEGHEGLGHEDGRGTNPRDLEGDRDNR